LRDEVIIRPIFEEQVGNIILFEGKGVYKQYHGFIYGEVISIGSRYPYKELQVGDKLLFIRHEGIPVRYEGVEYLILRQARVLAVLRD
jgi:co-chaperonin GroES (HSP10)